MVIIRRATIADAERLCRLNAPVQSMHAEARPDFFKPPSVGEEMVDYYRTRLSTESVYAYLGEVGAVLELKRWCWADWKAYLATPDHARHAAIAAEIFAAYPESGMLEAFEAGATWR